MEKGIKKLNKKNIKGYIIGFIIGSVVFGILGAGAATYFASGDVSYDNSVSGLKSTDVQSAIDELYNECFPPTITAADTITNLVSTNTNELYKDENGNIRYYGKNPNNYVSFNNELWRIIGVIDGKIKIIGNKSIENRYWASNGYNNWNNSDLKTYLNGTYYNSIDETYQKMISEETYYLGGPTSSNYDTLTASGYYNTERDSSQVYNGNPATTTQKIGLMYLSDYGYAAGSSCLSTVVHNYNSGCKNSDYLFSDNYEWLQVPSTSDSSEAVFLYSSGYVYSTSISNVNSNRFAVRPVLYLTSTTQITGGDGTSSSPFQLSV